MLCALVLLLSVSVCSVSASYIPNKCNAASSAASSAASAVASALVAVAASDSGGTLNNWLYGPPYVTDFFNPAGGYSTVVDVETKIVNQTFYFRYVFPNNSKVYIGFDPDNNSFTMLWSANKISDVVHQYTSYTPDVGFDIHEYNYIKPIQGGSGVYLGQINLPASSVVGVVSNTTIPIEEGGDPNNIIKIMPFPDEGIAEERKTQGMISQLIQDVKDWFSNLIESMGNFFSELGNKISSGLTALGDKIKGFFTQLVEDIKGLFVPSDGFFDEYSNNFELWAREHFGFLFETLEIVDTAINKYVSFSPSDDFVVTLPEASFTVKDKNYVLWEQQTFSVNSLLTSIPALSMFHTVYFTFVYALFFYLLYRLGEKAYTDIFGGSD